MLPGAEQFYEILSHEKLVQRAATKLSASPLTGSFVSVHGSTRHGPAASSATACLTTEFVW